MAQHNKLGEKGEIIAVNYLKSKGYIVHHTNWRMGHLEMDIIAEDGEELVFVEVKTRSSDEYGAPEESIDSKKEKDLITAGGVYLESLSLELAARFDVISIILAVDNNKLTHFEDAFSAMLLDV